MTFEELYAQLQVSREIFAGSVRDSFGQSIEEDVFDVCEHDFGGLQDASEQADREKQLIDAMLFELRLIVV